MVMNQRTASAYGAAPFVRFLRDPSNVFVSRQAAGGTFRCFPCGPILAVLLLASCTGPAPEPAGPSSGQGCNLSEIQELAADFARLRAVQGHFQGGPWTAEVDAWMGPKHQVMIELGDRLAEAGCEQAQVTDLLGPPDLIVHPGDPLFDQVRRQAEFEEPAVESYTLLVYYWRGAHDFLYFTSDGQTILGSGWWHALE
jgi:hypothetical protein